MAIEKINGVNGIQQTDKTGKVEKTSSVSSRDKIEFSSESKAIVEQKRIEEIVKNTSDIRLDKVEAAKIRLQSYMKDGVIREDVLEKMTSAIVDDFFGFENVED